jgi:hypothetical protein
MSTETKLRSAMAEAVAPTHPDLDQLVSVSRRRGLGIRRRRQVLGTVGVAAALGLGVLAPTVVIGDHRTGPAPAASASDGTVPETLDPSDTSPFTGRSTAAALLHATLEVAPDSLTGDFTWQGGQAAGVGETYARFQLHAGTDKPGEIGVNVQPGFTGKAAQDVRTCSDWMRSCTVDQLADGSVLVTYEDVSTYGSGGYRRVASLLRADDVRIVASASNGIDVTERDEKVTRDAPPLTTEQLTAIVEQPWWGAELPTYFARAGEKLHGEAISAEMYADPSAQPTP